MPSLGAIAFRDNSSVDNEYEVYGRPDVDLVDQMSMKEPYRKDYASVFKRELLTVSLRSYPNA